ncbi:filaggrin-like isoform X6 [Triticum dicoccoides]|uniref:filaggrin-like isoform X6 n=1 Tax=Triticum dicoccoides TaxID=85692 RepID=UPI00188FB1DD|nr:filaggrin-like isoform X6 [Triticum dicoccoides]
MVRSRSPKGGDDGRRRSTPRRSSDEQGGRKEKGPISLLVRNIPHNCRISCRYEDLRVPFAKFGPVRDIYMPKDYYSGEPKGFAFIEFFDSHDASEAQYHMNRKLFCGREIKVEPATDKRKRPEDMRRRTGVRVHSGSKGRDLSSHGRSRSRSHSRSPRQGGRDRSRSHSPAPRRRGDYSASPKRKEECQAKSSGQSKEHDNDKKLGSCTPGGRSERHDTDNYSNERRATPDYSAAPKRKEACQTKSPRQANEHDEDKNRISFSPDRNNCRDADNGHNERDDYFTSSKRKGERLSKSLRLSKEHDKDKKRRSYSRDDRSDCRDADNSFKERRATTDGGKRSCPRQRSPRPSSGSHSRRRDAYSASPKGKEEHREQSPRQSKEHDKHRKRRSNTPDDRNDCHGADHSHNEMQGDCSTSPRIKEERQAKSSRESEEYNKDTKGAPHDRNDRHDAVNGSRDSNLHVDRKPVTPDDEGSHACWRSPRPSSGSCSRKRDDCSASPNKKEERRAKSPKQSIEYKDEKRRSCTADDMNGRHNAVNGYKKRRDGYSASPKIKEECRAESPRPTKEREDNGGIDRTDADNGYNERRAGPDSASQKRMEKPPQAKSQSQSKEYDNGKENRSYTHDDGKECRNADNGSKVRKDYSAAGKRKEERQASLPRQSKEHDEHKKRGSYTRDDRNDLRDADNGSKERRKDYSAAGKRKEERQASLPRQSKEHDEHKKRGSYTPDDRDDPRDADNGSKERNDYSASRKRMEDYRAKSSRQSKEHGDDKKRGSCTPDDRSHRSDADNGLRERQGDFSASGQRKEEYRGKSPRQLKEHGDNKKRGSYTPADRNDLDNGCNEKLATHDGSRSACPGRRSPRPS